MNLDDSGLQKKLLRDRNNAGGIPRTGTEIPDLAVTLREDFHCRREPVYSSQRQLRVNTSGKLEFIRRNRGDDWNRVRSRYEQRYAGARDLRDPRRKMRLRRCWASHVEIDTSSRR